MVIVLLWFCHHVHCSVGDTVPSFGILLAILQSFSSVSFWAIKLNIDLYWISAIAKSQQIVQRLERSDIVSIFCFFLHANINQAAWIIWINVKFINSTQIIESKFRWHFFFFVLWQRISGIFNPRLFFSTMKKIIIYSWFILKCF